MPSPKRRKPHPPVEPVPQPPFVDRLLWWVIVAGVVVIPCVISPTGQDSFRFPKLLVFRAEGILLLTIVGIAAIWGKFDFRRYSLRDPAVWLPLAIVGWTAITTLTSHQPRVSGYSLLTVACGATVFLLTYLLAHGRGVATAGLVIIPGIVNVIVLWLASRRIWSPLLPDRWMMFSSRAEYRSLLEVSLQGNRNDLGTFLLIPTLVAIIFAVVSRGRNRLLSILCAEILVGSMIASRTITAMIALVAGCIAIAIVRSWKIAVVAIVIATIAGGLAVALFTPLTARAELMVSAWKSGDITRLLSGRPIGYASAILMARDHPLVGIGPGVFAREYFDYKIAADKRFGEVLITPQFDQNFGEAHNDYLQTLAEGGVAALGLLLTALALTAAKSTGPLVRDESRESRAASRDLFVRYSAFPLVAAFGLVAVAQFPLQLAATIHSLAFVGGVVWAWSR